MWRFGWGDQSKGSLLNTPAPLVDTAFALGLLKAQIFCFLLVAVVMLLFASALVVKSIVLGMLVGLCGSAFAVWRSYYSLVELFSGRRVRKSAKQVVSAMMQGVLGKMIVVMFGLILVFKYIKPLESGMLILGLMLMSLMAWVYPLFWHQKK